MILFDCVLSRAWKGQKTKDNDTEKMLELDAPSNKN